MSDLDDIKEGDYVALLHGGWSKDVSKLLVTRTTATRIHIGDTAYTRRGYRVGSGSGFGREYIRPWDEDHHGSQVAATRLRRVRRELGSFAWDRVDQATAYAVLDLIKPKGDA